MDPNATWNELKDAIARKDYREVYVHADYLLMWLLKGGFLPDGIGFERDAFCTLLTILLEGTREYL